MNAGFTDHFSSHAQAYARYRPRYPAALFHYLAMRSPGTRLAWDCGTGNGQAAVGLAERFARVLATDPSAAQIASAQRHPRVEYRVAMYDTGSRWGARKLVTAAQALHWMDVDAFSGEARRVLRPAGCWPSGATRSAALRRRSTSLSSSSIGLRSARIGHRNAAS